MYIYIYIIHYSFTEGWVPYIIHIPSPAAWLPLKVPFNGSAQSGRGGVGWLRCLRHPGGLRPGTSRRRGGGRTGCEQRADLHRAQAGHRGETGQGAMMKWGEKWRKRATFLHCEGSVGNWEGWWVGDGFVYSPKYGTIPPSILSECSNHQLWYYGTIPPTARNCRKCSMILH